MDNDQRGKEIEDKILAGLKLSYERLVAYKIKHDQKFAFSVNGEVVVIKARELHKLKDMQNPAGK